MPLKLLPISEIIDMETERGQKVRRGENKEPNNSLKNSIERRWQTARHFIDLPDDQQNAFIRSIINEIKIHRQLFEDILGTGSSDETIAGLSNGELHPVVLGNLVTQYLQEYVLHRPEKKALHAETIIALVTRNLAEELCARAENHKKQRILEVDTGGIDVDEHEFGVAKTNINDLIDDSKDDLEPTIKKVLRMMKRHIFSKKTQDISFTLVNEKNHYGEEQHLTCIGTEGETGKTEKNPAAELQLDENEPTYDEKTHSVYLKMSIKGKHLGTLRIQLKEKSEFDEYDMQMLKQIAGRLDTYIHLKLAGRTVEKVVEEGEHILEENKLQVDFEAGIKEIAALTCTHSRAKKAVVIFKKPGLKEEIFAQTIHRDGRSETMKLEPNMAQLLCEHHAKNVSVDHMSSGQVFDSRVRDCNLVYKDLVDIYQPHHPVIGKMILLNEEESLTEEEQRLLDRTSGLIDAHISRRKMNQAVLSKAMDPKVAEALSNGELKEISREKVTMFYVDIAGYTEKCQKLSQLHQGEKIFRLAETFLAKVQELGQKYGAVWDNAIGDCGVLLFGPPYYKNGEDGLGMTSKRPEYHAINGLKTSLAIQKTLGEINGYYEKLLVEVAREVYRHASTPVPSVDLTRVVQPEARDQYLLQKLVAEYQLKPKIEVTTGIYTADVNIGILNLPSAQKYTVLDDGMNMAARFQSAGLAGEALVPLETKLHLEKLIASDEAVPLNGKGEKQTWSEFIEAELEIEPTKETAEIEFIEEYYFMKNTRGPNLGYRVKLHRKPLDSKRETIKPGQLLTEDELLAHPGEYGIITSKDHPAENTVLLHLKTMGEPHVTFMAKIAQGKITNDKPHYVSHEDALRRAQQDEDDILTVHGFHLKAASYKSIEDELETMLKTNRLLNDDEIPVGMYEVMDTINDPNSEDYEIYNLRTSKGGQNFRARIPKQRVKYDNSPITNRENQELKAKYGHRRFAFERHQNERGPGWAPAKNIIYIQGSDYYIMPIEQQEAA